MKNKYFLYIIKHKKNFLNQNSLAKSNPIMQGKYMNTKELEYAIISISEPILDLHR